MRIFLAFVLAMLSGSIFLRVAHGASASATPLHAAEECAQREYACIGGRVTYRDRPDQVITHCSRRGVSAEFFPCRTGEIPFVEVLRWANARRVPEEVVSILRKERP